MPILAPIKLFSNDHNICIHSPVNNPGSGILYFIFIKHEPSHIVYLKTTSGIHCIFPNISLIYTLFIMTDIAHI